MSEGKQVAKRGGGLVELINSDKMKNQWAMVLPKCLPPDRLARVAITQIRKNPKLAQCSQESFLSSMMVCAEMGLEPNGRDAHLIPYGKECTLIPDYKGLVRLVRRDPNVKDVQVFTVRENDDFKWTPEGIEHSFKLGKDRGEVVGCYTKISWENGTVSYGEPMDKDDAEKIRKASRSGDNGPWVQWYVEMWKKSVIKRDSKMWPLAAETIDALTAEEEAIDVDVSAPVYDSDPLDGMKPADVQVNEPQDEEAEEATATDSKKLIASLNIIKGHRAKDFAEACEELGIPLDDWQNSPPEFLDDLLAKMNA